MTRRAEIIQSHRSSVVAGRKSAAGDEPPADGHSQQHGGTLGPTRSSPEVPATRQRTE